MFWFLLFKMDNKNLAIRFGLGAIKAVGVKMIESAVTARNNDGEFKDIYDFCTRMDAKNINKKSDKNKLN